MMSDVAFAKAPWWGRAIFLIGAGIVWLWGCIPVLIRRSEYERLRNNDCVIKDALRVMSENAGLRAKYEPYEPNVR